MRIRGSRKARHKPVGLGTKSTRPASRMRVEVEDAGPPIPPWPIGHARERCPTDSGRERARRRVRASIDPRVNVVGTVKRCWGRFNT